MLPRGFSLGTQHNGTPERSELVASTELREIEASLVFLVAQGPDPDRGSGTGA